MTADKTRIEGLWEVKNIIGACGERPFVASLVRVTGEGVVSWEVLSADCWTGLERIRPE